MQNDDDDDEMQNAKCKMQKDGEAIQNGKFKIQIGGNAMQNAKCKMQKDGRAIQNGNSKMQIGGRAVQSLNFIPDEPEGFKAISRWLSEATPPVTMRLPAFAPRQGC